MNKKELNIQKNYLGIYKVIEIYIFKVKFLDSMFISVF
jgi:hypothetical protein